MDDTSFPKPLISAHQLAEILDDKRVGIVDCRFSLDDTSRGERAWHASRIPGARYAHLDDDLSGRIGDGSQGRHPMLDPQAIHALRQSWGFSADTLVVCYDDMGGPFAARLWWMLRWIGHEPVCVLDGGWQAWVGAHNPVDDTPPPNQDIRPKDLPNTVSTVESMTVSADELLAGRVRPVDARAPERYEGRQEPIDPVAGRIPGAVNLPWQGNLDDNGAFLPADQLAKRWHDVGGTEHAVSYCGSGVTGCHNVLSAAIAGLPLPGLYPPSWSGWITDPSRPIEPSSH